MATDDAAEASPSLAQGFAAADGATTQPNVKEEEMSRPSFWGRLMNGFSQRGMEAESPYEEDNAATDIKEADEKSATDQTQLDSDVVKMKVEEKGMEKDNMPSLKPDEEEDDDDDLDKKPAAKDSVTDEKKPAEDTFSSLTMDEAKYSEERMAKALRMLRKHLSPEPWARGESGELDSVFERKFAVKNKESAEAILRIMSSSNDLSQEFKLLTIVAIRNASLVNKYVRQLFLQEKEAADDDDEEQKDDGTMITLGAKIMDGWMYEACKILEHLAKLQGDDNKRWYHSTTASFTVMEHLKYIWGSLKSEKQEDMYELKLLLNKLHDERGLQWNQRGYLDDVKTCGSTTGIEAVVKACETNQSRLKVVKCAVEPFNASRQRCATSNRSAMRPAARRMEERAERAELERREWNEVRAERRRELLERHRRAGPTLRSRARAPLWIDLEFDPRGAQNPDDRAPPGPNDRATGNNERPAQMDSRSLLRSAESARAAAASLEASIRALSILRDETRAANNERPRADGVDNGEQPMRREAGDFGAHFNPGRAHLHLEERDLPLGQRMSARRRMMMRRALREQSMIDAREEHERMMEHFHAMEFFDDFARRNPPQRSRVPVEPAVPRHLRELRAFEDLAKTKRSDIFASPGLELVTASPDFDAESVFIKRVTACVGWACHGLIFEYTNGTRMGTLLVNPGETPMELNDKNLIHRASVGWTDIDYGDYIVRIHGDRLAPGVRQWFCYSLTLEFASGKSVHFEARHEPWRGEPFEYTVPQPCFVHRISFKNDQQEDMRGLVTSIHLPMSRGNFKHLPVKQQKAVEDVLQIGREVDLGIEESGRKPLGEDVWWLILGFLAAWELLPPSPNVKGTKDGQNLFDLYAKRHEYSQDL